MIGCLHVIDMQWPRSLVKGAIEATFLASKHGFSALKLIITIVDYSLYLGILFHRGFLM